MATIWLNVYQTMNVIEDNPIVGYRYASREEAEADAGPRRLACIPVDDNQLQNSKGITILEKNVNGQTRVWFA